ncbi:tRNA nucleotidyltransferase [Fistulifera solaris]|jgi:tRNA nucleotidyltransferase (CCA-adding enzyme)|uniref:tRNA nucleotidyltransferase n=1 Tax=Fistulifera solaris TaxID=1519565 RepID=A0A1Z5JBM4_FISSO|nr:tRNA nucleotidyltransferase [Fistulifera solaris]|eukprot:GAX11218.1 tRNA nucleotidyltransferase [Fistulifera solaris]
MSDSTVNEPSIESVSYPTIISVVTEGEVATRTACLPNDSMNSMNATIPIQFTPTEHKFLQLLQRVPSPMQFRLAGGWVRDKLLQKQSHDIDVAVEHATGVEAAEWVVSQHAPPHTIVSSLGIVAANPEQSKHLETAVLKLYKELDVDFVPLRCAEVYSDPNSRIPQQTQPGTPYQDAMRRDFTLNALFFNVHTQCIEDWTGRGLVDLRRGVLVTPLDPVVTLQDDPLRLLRGLRFAVRYSFTLDPAFVAVAKEPYMNHMLQTKVSRERIGKECMGMWQADAVTALHTMYEWNIASSIFVLPDASSMSCIIKDPKHGEALTLERNKGAVDDTMIATAWSLTNTSLQAFDDIVRAVQKMNDSSTFSSLTAPYYQKVWTPVAAFLLPFRDYLCQDEKQKSTSAIAFIFRNSLKAKNVDVQCVTNLFDTLEMAMDLLLQSSESQESNSNLLMLDRLKAGRFVKASKTNWISSLYLAATVWFVSSNDSTTTSTTAKSCAVTVTRLIQAIHEAQLHEAWTILPLLPGKQLMQKLQLKPGPMIGEYQQRQLDFQYQNPNGTVDECLAYLQSSAKRLKQDE